MKPFCLLFSGLCIFLITSCTQIKVIDNPGGGVVEVALISPTQTSTPTSSSVVTLSPTQFDKMTDTPEIIHTPILATTKSPVTPTITPSTTNTPTPTQEQSKIFVEVISNNSTLRTGPGRHYPILSIPSKGTFFIVYGHNEDHSWLAVINNEETGWINARQTNYVIDETADLPYLTPPPTPTKTPTLLPLTRTPTPIKRTPRPPASTEAITPTQPPTIGPYP